MIERVLRSKNSALVPGTLSRAQKASKLKTKAKTTGSAKVGIGKR